MKKLLVFGLSLFLASAIHADSNMFDDGVKHLSEEVQDCLCSGNAYGEACARYHKYYEYMFDNSTVDEWYKRHQDNGNINDENREIIDGTLVFVFEEHEFQNRAEAVAHSTINKPFQPKTKFDRQIKLLTKHADRCIKRNLCDEYRLYSSFIIKDDVRKWGDRHLDRGDVNPGNIMPFMNLIYLMIKIDGN